MTVHHTDAPRSHQASDPGENNRLPRPTGKQLARLRQAIASYAGVGSVLLLLVVVLRVTQPYFGTMSNLLLVLETNAVLLVLAVGMTFVLLTGGVDLSVGGTVVLTTMLFGRLVTDAGLSPWLAVPVVVVLGTALGLLVNGGLIAGLGLNFFVVTIGTSYVFTNLGKLLTDRGNTISLYGDETIRRMGEASVFGVPAQVLVALGVFLVGTLVLRYTGYGRMIYAVGGNPEAARLAGINVSAVRASVYAITAAMSAVAGVMLSIRLSAASPSAAVGIELTVAAAVLLGGTSFMGGVGTMLGTLLGTLFLGVLDNGLGSAGISPFWEGVATGVVLVLAVLADLLRKRRSRTTTT
ncbi:ABC transporter permease [Dactylosporangium siamense]|uniref:Sugar ABC transporter permease n=1 Tax=Dactylosporangium siamense TaxID=685454 RepID=A0A919PD43_9ACTN|nr:ABC transporter permease [Dactylosporangium siamense]GIG42570.1 sugar ABC transporter permease [Dactylosporangium siamense]